MNRTKLQILIATFGKEGLLSTADMKLPEIPGIEYIISCQDPDRTIKDVNSIFPPRQDVHIHIFHDRGLGLNRSHALSLAAAPFVLLADDDLQYYPDALIEALRIMESHSDLDIFAFRYDGPDAKVYPHSEHSLEIPYKNYQPSSVELAFRLDSLRKHHLDFSPLLGVGARYLTSGEESIFLVRALQSGLRGSFFPLTILHHHDLSTGFHHPAPGALRSNGAYIRIRYGLIEGFARCVIAALRSSLPFTKALLYLLQGYFYSIRHRL